MNTNENTNYGYYSRKLNKPFDTLDELTAAEHELEVAEEEKKQKSELKKTAAKVVEDAYREKMEAHKNAAGVIHEAWEKYKESEEEARKMAEEADEKYNQALNEFLEKYPEGFHMTFKNGDGLVSTDFFRIMDNDFNVFDNFINSFNGLFRF